MTQSSQADSSGSASDARRRMLRGALLMALAAFLIRSPGLSRPLVGAFATKSVVYAMTARYWALDQAPPWRPTLDCLADGAPSWHLVEYPAPAYLTSLGWRLFGGSLDVWGRASAAVWSAMATGLLFVLAFRWHGERVAWWAASALALSPVGIIYGQNFMLEPAVAALSIAAITCTSFWSERETYRSLVLLVVSLAALWLTKIYMLVLLLPIVTVAMEGGVASRRRWFELSVALLLAAAPTALWHAWAWGVSDPANPESRHIYYSFRDSAGDHGFPHPMLLSASFHIALAQDLILRCLGPVAAVGALVGLIDRRARTVAPWLIAAAVLVIALPRKFHEMDYYFVVIAPPLCMLAGIGWSSLIERWRLRKSMALILVAWILFNARVAYRPAFVTPDEDKYVVVAGRAARELLSPGEPIATMHGSTIDLLYYCDAPGWALAPDDPQLGQKLMDATEAGARFLVVAPGRPVEKWKPPAEIAALEVVRGEEGFVIYRLPDVR